jgi:four helix bundle protein
MKNNGNEGNDGNYGFLAPRGDYRTLLSFQKAEVVYDITFRFAHKFLSKGDRTIDQMIQSARSGKKNILEGSKAGTTSKETEIKLTNVARASLEELLDDYIDYLRARPEAVGQRFERSSNMCAIWPAKRRRPRRLPRVCGNPPA